VCVLCEGKLTQHQLPRAEANRCAQLPGTYWQLTDITGCTLLISPTLACMITRLLTVCATC
jgi:hypothetical protein